MLIRGLWGIQLTPEQDYVIKASIGQFEGSQRTSVYMQFQDHRFLLCSLTPRKIEQQVLNITCLEGESVVFRSKGPNTIHLMGNYISQEGWDDQDESGEFMSIKQTLPAYDINHKRESMTDKVIYRKPKDPWQLYDDDAEHHKHEIEEEDDSDEDSFNPFDIFQNLGLSTNKKKKQSSGPLSHENTLFSPDDDLPSIPEPTKKTAASQSINHAVYQESLKLQKKSEKKQARREKKRQERLESKQQSKPQQEDTKKKKKKTTELSQHKLIETASLSVNNEPTMVDNEKEKTQEDQSSLNGKVTNTASMTKKLIQNSDTTIEDNSKPKAMHTQSKPMNILPKVETKAMDPQSKDTASSTNATVSRYPRRRATAESADKLRMIAKADATVAASVRREMKKKRASSNHHSQQPATKKVKNEEASQSEQL
ncbi:hypothetical protein CU098_013773 [Rhizopus stolonifer]|uniref:Nucleoplasmin-like domain-containing protein n=1 Tax=Rhizopus stolonifer TaxID=4846 RepID=A0A367KYB5_RHIST|nr:hypothetical protein CU098_013773 [Rhizopus stolonifer]